MSNFWPSASSSRFIKLVPTITTVCVTLGSVAIYDYQTNKPVQLTNGVGSNAALNPVGSGQIRGPEGPAGAQGETGLQGPKGDAGASGATGPAGAKGDAGATGPAGPQGATGSAGSSGSGGSSGVTVKDANGTIIENVMSVEVNSGVAFVINNGMLFRYNLSTGDFLAFELQNYTYLTQNCTGVLVTPYDRGPQKSIQFARFDYRYQVISGSKSSYFKANPIAKNGDVFYIDNNGSCVQNIYTNQYYELTPITTSQGDRPGPLVFSIN